MQSRAVCCGETGPSGTEVRSRSPGRGGTTANASAMVEEPSSSEDHKHVCAEVLIQEHKVCRLGWLKLRVTHIDSA